MGKLLDNVILKSKSLDRSLNRIKEAQIKIHEIAT
jgi:hypothetical protein